MILQRLYALAKREKLLDSPAFEELPVPYVVMVGEGGKYLGLQERRGTVEIPSKKKGGEPKKVPDKGIPLSVPRAHGNTANKGFARYFVDTLPRVLPLDVGAKDQAKADASRDTFWTQIGEAANGCDSPALKAVHEFGQRLEEFGESIRRDASAIDPTLTDRVTFAYEPDGGRTLLRDEAVRGWYANVFAAGSGAKQAAGPVGVCQVTMQVGPLPTTHPTKLQGIPGGMSVGVSLISFDKPAFSHYGMDGAENAGIGYEAADGYLRALDALIKNALPSVKAVGGKTSLRIGGTLFLYWTKDPADLRFMSLLDDPAGEARQQLPPPRPRDVAKVERAFNAVHEAKKTAVQTLNPNQFYMLGLSGNAARAVIRGYLESTLSEVQQNLADWFDDLRIADTSKEYQGKPNDRFPLKRLVESTALDLDHVASETSERLLSSALNGVPVPDSILAACLGRLKADGGTPLFASRLALVKLCLIRRNITVSELLDPNERNESYLYGRLLSLLDQIQNSALGDVNATVVDKFFRSMCVRPHLIAPRLVANAQAHLRKMRVDPAKNGASTWLGKQLGELYGMLPINRTASRLPLTDQGLFVLGFYHQQAKRFTPKPIDAPPSDGNGAASDIPENPVL